MLLVDRLVFLAVQGQAQTAVVGLSWTPRRRPSSLERWAMRLRLQQVRRAPKTKNAIACILALSAVFA